MSELTSEQLKQHAKLRMKFHKEFKDKPNLNTEIYAKSYQHEMITVMHHLLEIGDAKYSGIHYGTTDEKNPLFERENYDKGRSIRSVSWSTGMKLLREEPVLLKKPDKVEKLMQWLIQEFPTVTELSKKSYKKTDPEKCFAHIIAGAAHEIIKTYSLSTPCSEKKQEIEKEAVKKFEQENENLDFISRMTRKEKFLFIAGLFVLSVALIVFYYRYPKVIHYSLAGLLFLSALFSLIALIVLKKKYQSTLNSKKNHHIFEKKKYFPKLIASGFSIMALSLFLVIYQLLLLTLLPPHERIEAPYAIFIALLFTFLINIFCVYQALFQITYALSIFNRNSLVHLYFSRLNKYKKNINPIAGIIPFLLFASMSLVALANMSSLWEAYLDFGGL